MMTDHTFWVYTVICFISLVGSYLFLEEVYNKWGNHVSAVFLYVLILMVGTTVVSALNAISRYYTLIGDFHILHSWYWPYRWYVTGAGLVCIVGHMAYRRYFEKINE